TVEFEGGRLRAGLGSAITLDSEPAAEIAEWRAKSRFLARAEAPVAALETLLLDHGVAVRGEAHLARMQRTARHFGLRFSLAEAKALMHNHKLQRVGVTNDAFELRDLMTVKDIPKQTSYRKEARDVHGGLHV
ncbi:hypothetical protein, partial [Escherichia coli]|uniref:hypothetical protein n=1 Tax=Escherichia coli TaxID=562 RepID=UPI00201DF311